jgi:hypothetical protein
MEIKRKLHIIEGDPLSKELKKRIHQIKKYNDYEFVMWHRRAELKNKEESDASTLRIHSTA